MLCDDGQGLWERMQQSQRIHIYSNIFSLACTCPRSATWGSVPQGALKSIPKKKNAVFPPPTVTGERTQHN